MLPQGSKLRSLTTDDPTLARQSGSEVDVVPLHASQALKYC